jgi:hypothetical protein
MFLVPGLSSSRSPDSLDLAERPLLEEDNGPYFFCHGLDPRSHLLYVYCVKTRRTQQESDRSDSSMV